MSTPSDKTLRLERTKLTPQPPRGGRNTTLIVAVVAGVAAAILAGVWLNNHQPTQVAVQPAAPVAPVTTPVVVAAQDIPAQTVITPNMVTQTTVDQGKLQAGAVVNTADILTKTTMLPFKKGDQILGTAIAPNQQQFAGMASMLKPGQRAMTIALDSNSSVAGFLKPGDHVDVIGTFSVGQRTITRTVLQNVTLLATGAQVMQQTPDPTAAANNNNGVLAGGNSNDPNQPQPQPAKPQEIPNATVEVSPIDSEKLIMASNKGKLMLTLRSNRDLTPSVVPTVDETAVTTLKEQGQGGAAPPPPPPPPINTARYMPPLNPVAPPPPPPSIMVIRGSTAQTVTLPS
jgi:pilus assembly protein CpaB